jgi:hypothetical protein
MVSCDPTMQEGKKGKEKKKKRYIPFCGHDLEFESDGADEVIIVV